MLTVSTRPLAPPSASYSRACSTGYQPAFTTAERARAARASRRCPGTSEERDEEQRGRDRAQPQVAQAVDPAEQRDHRRRARKPRARPQRDGEPRGRVRRAGLVDEVEREEADEDVEQQVGELEQEQPAQHLAPRDRAQRVAHAQPLAVRGARPGGADGGPARASRRASAANSPRQPSPAHARRAASSGPPIAPIEPATVQRAMLCSRRDGSRSMSDACESETNAPDAG